MNREMLMFVMGMGLWFIQEYVKKMPLLICFGWLCLSQ